MSGQLSFPPPEDVGYVNNGQSDDLPPGWAWTTLGEIAAIQGGIQKGKSRNGRVVVREVPYLRVANVQRGYLDLTEIKTIQATEDEIDALRLASGDVLLNEGGDRDKLGRGWVWNCELPECIHQNHVFRARIKTPDILPRYVSWYANGEGQRYFFDEGSQTTNLASLNSTKLRAFPVPLAPASEQKRIVDEISSYVSRLDAAIAGLQRVQANLQRYRASVLQAAVEGRLVPTEAEVARQEGREYEPASVLLERILIERRRRWEEAELAKMTAKGKVPKDDGWKAKYEEPCRPSIADAPQLPQGWCWATIDQLAEVGTGTTPKRGASKYWQGGHIPWVTSSVVNSPIVVEPSEYVTEAAIRETNLHLCGPGTILVAMYGEGKTRGRATVLGIKSTTNQALATLTLGPDAEPLRSWILLALESSYEQTRRLSSGGVQPNLNLSLVRGICMPIPPERIIGSVLDQVAHLLAFCDVAAATTQANMIRTSRLRQSILKAAFEGKLVDQDPNDEPASALLARLRAERDPSAHPPTPTAPRSTTRRRSKRPPTP